jgi:hypothetical protein
MKYLIALLFLFCYTSFSFDNSCTTCPDGDGWVGPITVISHDAVDCNNNPCYLYFKYCYRVPDSTSSQNPFADLEVFVCSWGPVGPGGRPTDWNFPCSFNLLPCDSETQMEKIKRLFTDAIALDLAEKGLIVDCEFDDEFLIRYIMTTCYQTIYENNIQEQVVYIIGHVQCEDSGSCTETYRYCIDLNEPNGPPTVVFKTKVASEVNQLIECTTDYLYLPSFNPTGPEIIYGPCFGVCEESYNE